MKKLLIILVSLLFTAAMMSAQYCVGVRTVAGLNFDTDQADGISLNQVNPVNWGGAIWGNLQIYDKIGLQPEIGFTINNCTAVNSNEISKITYNSIDFPLLVTYCIYIGRKDILYLTTGPYFSLPINTIITNNDGISQSESVFSFLAGAEIGGEFLVPLSTLIFTIDTRYKLDLISIRSNTPESTTKQSVLFSIGCVYDFK